MLGLMRQRDSVRRRSEPRAPRTPEQKAADEKAERWINRSLGVALALCGGGLVWLTAQICKENAEGQKALADLSVKYIDAPGQSAMERDQMRTFFTNIAPQWAGATQQAMLDLEKRHITFVFAKQALPQNAVIDIEPGKITLSSEGNTYYGGPKPSVAVLLDADSVISEGAKNGLYKFDLGGVPVASYSLQPVAP